MDAETRKALDTIRRCVARGRVRALPHFRARLMNRGLLWADALAAIDEPEAVTADGEDDWDRPRWIIAGPAADGTRIGLVCVIGRDAKGELTVFITAYWDD